MTEMATLVSDFVLGCGEVGTALREVLTDAGFSVLFYDKTLPESLKDVPVHADYLHVAIPFDGAFSYEVESWRLLLTPDVIIVHSTVPIGTCAALCAVHSPVVGIHPFLVRSLYTFVKWFGGYAHGAVKATDHFRRAGLRVHMTEKSETTEVLKLMDTLLYGMCLEFTREVERECMEAGVSFEAWSLYTAMYNEGYIRMGRGEFVRPNLVPPVGKLGGHCILPNAHLLHNDFTELLLRRNGEESDE
jgi:hypothetical protein